jgi:triosephosphate isomerase
MRTKVVAGNWKMNNDHSETQILIEDLKKQTYSSQAVVMIAPAFTNLSSAVNAAKGSNLEVIAQNMHFADSGAFTGEVSADMLKSIGVHTVILGHSERRAYFNETDADLAKKVSQALSNGMKVVFCFGEELGDRKSSNAESVVEAQLKNALFHLEASDFDKIILAYEPVWAIGTGETATPDQAQEMHAFVRATIASKYGQGVADSISIVYGGSVKPSNAEEIFSKPDVDGGLIGGASLKAEDFFAIVNAI